MITQRQTGRLRARIAGLGLRFRVIATPADAEVGVLEPVESVLDQVGDDPDVALPRRWKEDCRSYRLRLQLFCQEEILRRERFDELLSLLLETERTQG